MENTSETRDTAIGTAVEPVTAPASGTTGEGAGAEPGVASTDGIASTSASAQAANEHAAAKPQLVLPRNPTLAEIEAVFAGDRFATQAAGCTVVEGSWGHAVCEMELADIHRNAMGNVMGGAIFTLADFALAIACNIGEAPSVSVDHAISFMRSTKGKKLIARATCEKPGTHLAFYTVEITDDLGKLISRMTATCYR